MMIKYLGVKFKDGEYKKYEWDKVDFVVTNVPELFVVRSEGELLLGTPLENIKYYERVEEE